MSTQRKEFSLKGQKIFVGLDVHLKNSNLCATNDAIAASKYKVSINLLTMKRILTVLAAVVCLCGCEKFFTPSSVTMSSSGETITVQTIISPETLDILNYDGEGVHSPKYDEETEVFTVTHEWLTASIAKDSFNGEGWEMILTAEKNTTGKRRTLYVGGMHGNLASSMRVTQK